MAIRFEHRNGRRVAVHYPNTDAEAEQSWAALSRSLEKYRDAHGTGETEVEARRLAEIEYKKFQDLQAQSAARAEHEKFIDIQRVRYKYVRPSGSRSVAA